jgi:autoinducer 2-degrading protein
VLFHDGDCCLPIRGGERRIPKSEILFLFPTGEDMPFVVIAEFTLKAGMLNEFLTFAHADANASLANEEGCFAFDVLTSESDTNLVVLHEIYRDREAFDRHTQMPHYPPFKKGTAPLLDGDPRVRFFQASVIG